MDSAIGEPTPAIGVGLPLQDLRIHVTVPLPMVQTAYIRNSGAPSEVGD